MTTTRSDTAALRRHEAAAEWLVRLQESDVPADEWLAWQLWMDENPGNQRAFDEAIHTLQRTTAWREALAGIPLASEAERKADRYAGEEPVADWLHRASRNKQRDSAVPAAKRTWKFPAALAAGLAAMAVISAVLLDGRWPETGGAGQLQIHQTADSEHREITLRDGSAITLGAKSAVAINYSRQSRAVVLEQGEAMFTVAKDADRPFLVVAGSGTIRALGTAFNVRLDDERVVVTVTEGRVEVERRETGASFDTAQASPPEEPKPRTMATLTQGQQVVYDTSRLGAVEAADPEVATAWRTGRLQYRAEPLKYVVDGVNRYSTREIIIADRKVEQLRFTGSVFNDQADEWLDGLEQVFPVEIVEIGDGKVLIRYRAAPSQ